MSEQPGGGRGWRGRQQGWDPMGELQSLRAELSRLVGGTRPGPPEVELTETAEGWQAVVRLPGVAPEEVAVELDDRELCVRARSEAEVNADQGIPGGFQTRGFEYRIDLPSRVDPDRIDAVMDHGLLRVRLPRAARPAPRTITVGRAGPRVAGPGTGHPVDPAADRELHHPDLAAGRELHHPDRAADEIDRP
ncbi:Hsp20/alpha crystallin family protein [Micromonospora sp. MW-13]|uniref:Hsp20/alpha crystallin family protein n=1 Tax=Micromonospora sp. MW-13 TaxID=2094022 RepID=UPI000E44BEE8|nr:Hsp20/alpha crystallin family protein [Micromonospora sp. MW-13]RGC68329.1 Hsp20/alpha crystallin family protein [Micromonospora sp. MW-13]